MFITVARLWQPPVFITIVSWLLLFSSVSCYFGRDDIAPTTAGDYFQSPSLYTFVFFADQPISDAQAEITLVDGSLKPIHAVTNQYGELFADLPTAGDYLIVVWRLEPTGLLIWQGKRAVKQACEDIGTIELDFWLLDQEQLQEMR